MNRSVVFALGLVVHATANALIPISDVRLSKADLKSVEQIACVQAHSTDLESASAYVIDREKTIHANVTCKSHDKVGDRPLRFTFICEKKSKWRCSTSALEIVAKIEGKPAAVRATDIPLQNAAEIVEALGTSGWFQRHSLKDLAQGGCSVGREAPRIWSIYGVAMATTSCWRGAVRMNAAINISFLLRRRFLNFAVAQQRVAADRREYAAPAERRRWAEDP